MHRAFADRIEAGRVLANALGGYARNPDVVVLGLPRGGVPVAFEVATALGAPLHAFIVRKLGVPGHEELAMGAIASGGIRFINQDVVEYLGIDPRTIDRVAEREQEELERRDREYRGNAPPPGLTGKVVILVDDGLATGSSMRAAVAAVRSQAPQKIVVAVPVGARSTCSKLSAEADEVVCASMPEPFEAVGQWYVDFSQTSDGEVKALLQRSRA